MSWDRRAYRVARWWPYGVLPSCIVLVRRDGWSASQCCAACVLQWPNRPHLVTFVTHCVLLSRDTSRSAKCAATGHLRGGTRSCPGTLEISSHACRRSEPDQQTYSRGVARRRPVVLVAFVTFITFTMFILLSVAVVGLRLRRLAAHSVFGQAAPCGVPRGAACQWPMARAALAEASSSRSGSRSGRRC